jgi:hypothetical protein
MMIVHEMGLEVSGPMKLQKMTKCGANVAICLYMLYTSRRKDCGWD